MGAAYHLQQQCKRLTDNILNAQSAIGGTWPTHTYPGIRSDSDLFTFGYRFNAWKDAPIASAASAAQILTYLHEVIAENDMQRHIRHPYTVLSANWSRELQRSPTYYRTAANANELANALRQLDIPQEWTHANVRCFLGRILMLNATLHLATDLGGSARPISQMVIYSVRLL